MIQGRETILFYRAGGADELHASPRAHAVMSGVRSARALLLLLLMPPLLLLPLLLAYDDDAAAPPDAVAAAHPPPADAHA